MNNNPNFNTSPKKNINLLPIIIGAFFVAILEIGIGLGIIVFSKLGIILSDLDMEWFNLQELVAYTSIIGIIGLAIGSPGTMKQFRSMKTYNQKGLSRGMEVVDMNKTLNITSKIPVMIIVGSILTIILGLILLFVFPLIIKL